MRVRTLLSLYYMFALSLIYAEKILENNCKELFFIIYVWLRSKSIHANSAIDDKHRLTTQWYAAVPIFILIL